MSRCPSVFHLAQRLSVLPSSEGVLVLTVPLFTLPRTGMRREGASSYRSLVSRSFLTIFLSPSLKSSSSLLVQKDSLFPSLFLPLPGEAQCADDVPFSFSQVLSGVRTLERCMYPDQKESLRYLKGTDQHSSSIRLSAASGCLGAES